MLSMDTARTIVGIIGNFTALVLFLSPLEPCICVLENLTFKLVITTKSVEYMPFSISLCSFVTGVCWTVYAFLPIDPYILAPNGIGALAGLAQLVLYAKYYKSNKSVDENSQVDMEVGMSEFDLSTHAKKPSSEA
nr:bidirectional sugar transporter SWEET4-like [Ipomoea batatas]